MLAALPVSHVIARWFASNRRVGAGHSRDVMPALPTTPPTTGRAERRWDAQVSKLEDALLARFEGGARGVEAHALAAQLGAQPAYVEAALSQLREAMPCRLQVTRSGKLLHDFEASDVAAMRAARRLAWPRRVALTALGALANVGAAWPVITLGGLAAVTLGAMAREAYDAPAHYLGVLGLLGVGALFMANLALGALSVFLLTPRRDGPTLGPSPDPVLMSLAAPPVSAPAVVKAAEAPLLTFVMDDDVDASPAPAAKVRTAEERAALARDLIQGDKLLREAQPSALTSPHLMKRTNLYALGYGWPMLLVALLLAVVAGSVLAVGIWLRGLWRASQGLMAPERDVSPARWAQRAAPIDRYEWLIPTNDLVLRTMQALHRVYVSRRPADGELASRVLVLARERGGMISALEIALYEGLDLDEAAEVGARLTGRFSGQIAISPLGELAFRFTYKTLRQVEATLWDDLGAEYVSLTQGRVARRRYQEPWAVPVNLVGLSYAHLSAMGRLVAGTYLMAMMGLWAMHALYLSAPLLVLGGGALVAMVWGVTGLVALANYTAQAEAAHGVQRDMRRAAMRQVRDALDRGATHVDLSALGATLQEVFQPAWEAMPAALMTSEVRGVCVDLGLELELEAGGREVFKLQPLRERLEALAEVSPAFDDEVIFAQSDEDPVMFDTLLSHERVSATL